MNEIVSIAHEHAIDRAPFSVEHANLRRDYDTVDDNYYWNMVPWNDHLGITSVDKFVRAPLHLQTIQLYRRGCSISMYLCRSRTIPSSAFLCQFAIETTQLVGWWEWGK